MSPPLNAFERGAGGAPIDSRYAIKTVNWADLKAADFQNGYSGYAGSPLYTPSYVRDDLGFVHLRGLLGNSSAWTTGVMFALPAGFSPTHDEYFSAPAYNNVGALLGTAMLNTTAGLPRLSIAVAPTVSWSSIAFISISGITWHAP